MEVTKNKNTFLNLLLIKNNQQRDTFGGRQILVPQRKRFEEAMLMA